MTDPDRTRFRLVTDHDTEDDDEDVAHEWDVDRRSVPIYLSADGREIPTGAHLWRTLTCGAPQCPATALYRLDLVEREAAAWEARRNGATT